MADICGPYDAQFVERDNESVFQLILTANFLDFSELINLTCAATAAKIKGKTPDEIRATFGIVDDYTSEEAAQIEEENAWAFTE